jgi:hypothetical protein
MSRSEELRNYWSEDETRVFIIFLSKSQKFLDDLKIYTMKPLSFIGCRNYYRAIKEEVHMMICAYVACDRQKVLRYSNEIMLNVSLACSHSKLELSDNDLKVTLSRKLC